jgi:hypothetical protein
MKTEFTVVPMRNVKIGEMFLPIERMGEPVYVTKKHRWEREWTKARKSYVLTGVARGVDDSGADGVFSLFDYAVVRRPVSVPTERPTFASKMANLAVKFNKR